MRPPSECMDFRRKGIVAEKEVWVGRGVGYGFLVCPGLLGCTKAGGVVVCKSEHCLFVAGGDFVAATHPEFARGPSLGQARGGGRS